MKRLSDFNNKICNKCVHRRYADECINCLVFDGKEAKLINFFPTPYFAMADILARMSDKEIEDYLENRNAWSFRK